MSNRNLSFLKRFKTEKTERNSQPNKLCNNKTPTSRLDKSNRSPAHEQYVYNKIELVEKENYAVRCANHPSKPASYELKQSLKEAYCQECSLKLVKYNIRMVRITEQTLCLRALYEAQIQRLFDYEEETKELIQKYFETQRQIVKHSFILAKQSNEKRLNVPVFKPTLLNETSFNFKLQELVGSVQAKKIEFVGSPQEKDSTISQEKAEFKQEDLGTQGENKENKNSENMNVKNIWMDARIKRMVSKQGRKSACLK